MRRFLVLAFLVAALPAQIPSGQQTQVATVHLLAPTTRTTPDVTTCVVPFAQGVYHGEPLCVADVQGRPASACQVAPLGPRWPDGSWRTARVTMHVPALQAWQPHQMRLLSCAGERPAFAWSDAILRQAGGLRLGFRVGDNVSVFRQWHTLEDGHLVKAWRARLRLPSPMWAELTLEARTGLDSLRFWLHYGNSDQTDPKTRHEVPAMAFLVTGATPTVWHQSGHVGIRVARRTKAVLLSGADTWSDGESKALSGSLQFGGALDSSPTLAVAEWQGTGAFGPWGILPEIPDGWDSPKSVARARDQLLERIGLWDAPRHGCNKDPGSTGNQSDFRAVALGEAAQGFPAMLWPVGRSVYQEACRPTWVRNARGGPYPFSIHTRPGMPRIYLWNGQVHSASPTKLGKPNAPGRGAHGFTGHDRQHWSINYLTFWTLLTGDRWGMAACQHHTELWLGSMQTSSGNATIDGIGAARAVGRTLQAGTMLYLVTGREDLARQIRARVQRTKERYTGRNPTFLVRPLSWDQADGRIGKTENPPDGYDWWAPWQEAVGVRGLDAVDQVFDSAVAREVRDIVAKTLVIHGTWRTSQGLVVGYAVRWNNGSAIPQPTPGMRSGTGTFNVWSWPAFQVAVETVPQAQAFLDQMERMPWSWDASEWRVTR